MTLSIKTKKGIPPRSHTKRDITKVMIDVCLLEHNLMDSDLSKTIKLTQGIFFHGNTSFSKQNIFFKN